MFGGPHVGPQQPDHLLFRDAIRERLSRLQQMSATGCRMPGQVVVEMRPEFSKDLMTLSLLPMAALSAYLCYDPRDNGHDYTPT